MFDTESMNENLLLSLYIKNMVDVLFWSIVLDIVVAKKNYILQILPSHLSRL